MGAIDRRIGALFLVFLALLVIAVARAIDLGSLQAGNLQRAAVTQQVSLETVPAERGSIMDRNGVELAISESADDVAADPYLIKDPATVAAKLAPILGRPPSSIETLLSKPHTGFVYLAHRLPGDLAAQINRVRINGMPLNGITVLPTVRRVYPREWTAAQVLGSVGWNNRGMSGLELRYNAVLGGRNGERRIVNDAIGQPISIDDVRSSKPGKSLTLTVDSALQDRVEQVLAGVGAQFSPVSATAIVMDPNTGAILALANWPRMNANDPGGAPPRAQEDQAVSFNYEPGSTFKAITVAGALQDGLVAPETEFDVPAQLQVFDRTIHDAEPHPDEPMSVAQILQRSSNIGADEIGGKLGKQRFDYWVHRFGFGSRTGVDLPGDFEGYILPWWKYSGASMGNLPFGQGESVTPMQIATAYAAIANGGILRPPHIVAAIGGKPVALPAGHRVISPATASDLRNMLQGVYNDTGTASGAGIPGYDMAGKTGTANIAVNGHYSDTEYVASFVGMVPTSHPQLLGLVVVNQPQGSIFGGAVAAPAFQQIVGWAVPYFGISPK